MSIYQWNIGNTSWLTLANSVGDARAVLLKHLTDHRIQFSPDDCLAMYTALNGPPAFVAPPEYPIVVGSV